MEVLSKLGFKKIGEWHKHQNNLSFEIGDFKKENKVVYAFVVNSLVKYIALTDDVLEFTLNFFITPKEFESEETKVKEEILKVLNNSSVEIYALKNKKFFGLTTKFSQADIIKLVKEFNAEWNEVNLLDRMKKIVSTDRVAIKKDMEEKQQDLVEDTIVTATSEEITSADKEVIETKIVEESTPDEKVSEASNPYTETIAPVEVKEEVVTSSEIIETKEENSSTETVEVPATPEVKRKKREYPSYVFTLGRSYADRGFFNLKTSHSQYVGNDKEDISILIGDKDLLLGKVSRTANSSGTPRIIGNKPLKMWFNKHSEVNGEIKITFINKKKIRLEVVNPKGE